jgi:hypothetical protein
LTVDNTTVAVAWRLRTDWAAQRALQWQCSLLVLVFGTYNNEHTQNRASQALGALHNRTARGLWFAAHPVIWSLGELLSGLVLF